MDNERSEALLRALIWLGDGALPVLQSWLSSSSLSHEQFLFITNHSQSMVVRALQEEHMDLTDR